MWTRVLLGLLGQGFLVRAGQTLSQACHHAIVMIVVCRRVQSAGDHRTWTQNIIMYHNGVMRDCWRHLPANDDDDVGYAL